MDGNASDSRVVKVGTEIVVNLHSPLVPLYTYISQENAYGKPEVTVCTDTTYEANRFSRIAQPTTPSKE